MSDSEDLLDYKPNLVLPRVLECNVCVARHLPSVNVWHDDGVSAFNPHAFISSRTLL